MVIVLRAPHRREDRPTITVIGSQVRMFDVPWSKMNLLLRVVRAVLRTVPDGRRVRARRNRFGWHPA